MYRNVLLGFGAAAIVALGACRAPGQAHDDIQQAADAHGVVTISGCLQADQQAGLVLVNAMLADEPAGIPVINDTEQAPHVIDAPATSGAFPAVLSGPRYTVEPPADINLQPHVGGQVQITGTVHTQAARHPETEGDRPVGTTGAAPYGRDAAADADRGIDGHVRANEVRLIAQTCQ